MLSRIQTFHCLSNSPLLTALLPVPNAVMSQPQSKLLRLHPATQLPLHHPIWEGIPHRQGIGYLLRLDSRFHHAGPGSRRHPSTSTSHPLDIFDSDRRTVRAPPLLAGVSAASVNCPEAAAYARNMGMVDVIKGMTLRISRPCVYTSRPW